MDKWGAPLTQAQHYHVDTWGRDEVAASKVVYDIQLKPGFQEDSIERLPGFAKKLVSSLLLNDQDNLVTIAVVMLNGMLANTL